METNNWTRLLIFYDKINFYFLKMFLNMTSVVYCRIFLHFMSSLINNKKTNSESVSTPKIGVLNVGFALKLRIYRSLKSVICLKWIRSFRSFRQHCVLSSTTYLAPLMSICFKGGWWIREDQLIFWWIVFVGISRIFSALNLLYFHNKYHIKAV